MIVDMMRNDLGRVARVGTVSVPELFTLERYPTVWQMTSLVTAETDASLDADLRRAASVGVGDGRPEGQNDGDPGGPGAGAARGLHRGDRVCRARTATPSSTSRFARPWSTSAGSGCRSASAAGSSGIRSAAGEYDECLLKGAVLGRAAAGVRAARDDALDAGRGVLSARTASAPAWRVGGVLRFPIRRSAGSRCARTVACQEPPGPLRVRLLLASNGGCRSWNAPRLQVAKRAGAREARRVAGQPRRRVPVPQDDESGGLRPALAWPTPTTCCSGTKTARSPSRRSRTSSSSSTARG